ncbi:M23 family metallopeptidase [Paenibacillus doosanensis]|nr:M23 family metallopeptidase [Paenibacillus doosanensis]
MESRKRGKAARARKSRRTGLLLSGVLVAALGVGVCYGLWKGQYIAWPMGGHAGGERQQNAQAQAPKYKQAAEFEMNDLEHGWVRFEDAVMITSDGGMTWKAADAVPELEQASAADEGDMRLLHGAKTITALQYQSREYTVKQAQFWTDRIGWALVNDDGEAGGKLFITTDGGATWKAEVTGEVKEALEREKLLIEQRAAEASRYASAGQAKQAIGSEWYLMPSSVSQGDAVLVRRDKPGEVEWQGKTYALQPSGAGYFTYLPVGTDVKPGDYPIGDQTLKVLAKNFPKQYLQVTEELDSMRQDTKRIDADQKRIDAARSKSQPDFLFTEPFLKPIEGILTTPYGHMRYVNGKLSGSHLALDLAAKQGTPIKATNDGIVALADSLYLTGNSIYIDHGMGLFSQYAHMSELRVKTGDRVKRGDIIGLVGSTGFSTGPHLHFTFWAHNVPVNPDLYFNTTPFQWTDKS